MRRLTVLLIVLLACGGLRAEETVCRDALILAKTDIVLGSELRKKVARVPVKEDETVKEGQLLVELDNEAEKIRLDLARLRKENQNALEAARTAHEKAQVDLERVDDLYKKGGVSEFEFRKTKAQERLAAAEVANQQALLKEHELNYRMAQVQLEQTRITSPIDGRVLKLYKEPGEYVDEREEVVRLIDLKQVYVVVRLPQSQLGRVKKGDRTEVVCSECGDDAVTLEGEVEVVSPIIDPASKTFSVKLLLENEDEKLKPGLTATVKFVGKD